MNKISTDILQLILGLSVIYVWVFRFHNVVLEFKQFGLNDTTRNAVGASKIALSTLLIAGIWTSAFIFQSALLMGAFMLGAQYFHYKVNNPLVKRIPSFLFLVISALIAYSSIQ